LARTDVTTTKLGYGYNAVAGAGTAVDQANGMRVLCGKARKVLLRVTNTSAGTPTVTIRKGASQKAADFVSLAIPATTGVVDIRPSPELIQADGGLYVDFTAGATGVIFALELAP
jgi:hypothetical protein